MRALTLNESHHISAGKWDLTGTTAGLVIGGSIGFCGGIAGTFYAITHGFPISGLILAVPVVFVSSAGGTLIGGFAGNLSGKVIDFISGN